MRTSLRAARGRSAFLLGFSCLLLAVAELRLLELQVLRARDPADSAIYRGFAIEEEGRRGDIRDARGGLLATSVREVDLRVWTGGISSSARRDAAGELAARLAEICGVDPEETRRKLAKRNSWTLLATGIRDPGVIASLRELAQQPGFRALSLETRHVREWPRGTLLAPLLGWVGWQPCERDRDDPWFDPDGPDGEVRGVAGIEALCEAELAPTRGRRLVHRDGRQREMTAPELEEPGERARDGRTVELTIEPLAQALAEEAIDQAVAEFTPDWAQIVVLDPRTAEVQALSQRPAPLHPRPRSEEELPLHELLPLQRPYPPGSSFKPFMLGLVLERGAATSDTVVDCENGAAAFGGRRVVHDTHPKSSLTVAEVLVESSNIGMAKLLLRLVPEDARKGDPAFAPVLDHLRGLGFAAPLYGFPGETGALVPRLRTMTRNYSLVSLSFGQEISVTAVQMAAACAAVANGGVWQPARFVRGAPAAPPRAVFTPRTAAELRRLLQRVVEQGATRRWKPAGWSIGGKTGTAEDERNGKVPVSSYWCFGPAHDPRFLVLAVLYHPRHGRFAADNAAKVAAPLLGRLLERFEVPRDRPEELERGEPLVERAVSPRELLVVSSAVGEGG